MADLANVFSWSRSRAGMFEECRRRYYYHYYGAWGGWDSNAPPDIRRLYVLNPRSANPLAAPAVVCVDEIDLHLHQRWQRNLMKSLSEVFPKTQFICSAHNRTVAQAVPPDANLVLLRRKGDHVEIHNNAAELLEGVQ